MENNSAMQKFIDQVKAADLSQLLQMKSAIRNANLIVTTFAMTLILLTFHYPTILMFIIAPIGVCFFAIISTSFDKGIKIINERITMLTDK